MKQWALLLKLIYENADSAPVALLKFQTLKDMIKSIGLMTVLGLEKNIQKFQKTVFSISNLVKRENELSQLQLKNWRQQCSRSTGMVCNKAFHGKLLENLIYL